MRKKLYAEIHLFNAFLCAGVCRCAAAMAQGGMNNDV
jgi:hypothetical protein